MPDVEPKPRILTSKRRRRRRRRSRQFALNALAEFAIAITVAEFAGLPRQNAARTSAILAHVISAHPSATEGSSR
jgi:hypothetical protein